MAISRIALVANSNGLRLGGQQRLARLVDYLRGAGVEPVLSEALTADGNDMPVGHGQYRPYNPAHAAPDAERARILERFYADPSIDAIFDVSGGDLANGVLSHLDFDIVRAHDKPFVGYSDLSTLVNAIHVETGRVTYWWQILGLAAEDSGDARSRFERTLEAGLDTVDDRGTLFELDVRFARGEAMAGELAGGNLRCFLKLAGTRWWPSLEGKILALESLGTDAPGAYSYLTQLRHMGAFQQVSGVLLGQHTKITKMNGPDAIEQMLEDVLDADVPVARTESFGHSDDSRALRIGAHYEFAQS